jgi:tetratricopeptide (TPR) repeat protein
MRIHMSVALGVTMGVTLVAATMAPTTAAVAEQADEPRQCAATTGVSPEQKLASCTAVIAAGLERPQNLAITFNNRGNAYLNKRDLDRAIADFDEAIRLDPKYDRTYGNRAAAYRAQGKTAEAAADEKTAQSLKETASREGKGRF